eukprot:1312488-Rhodomonas_salina.2
MLTGGQLCGATEGCIGGAAICRERIARSASMERGCRHTMWERWSCDSGVCGEAVRTAMELAGYW